MKFCKHFDNAVHVHVSACAQVYEVPDDEDFDPDENVSSVEQENVSSQTSSTIQVKIEDDTSLDHKNGQTSSSQLAASESLPSLTKPLTQPAA